MRIFHIHNGGVQELTAFPAQMPAQGFVWIACGRPAFQARLAEIQARLQTLVGLQLVDLHVSDLLNAQMPSHYDYTSQYDLLVFRRLATAQGDTVDSPVEGDSPASPLKRSGPVPGARVPASPADLMLRVVNMMVDRYLDLRRELTRQLDHWQNELLKPRARYVNWSSLLEARLALHKLDEICEDQRTAVQDWIDALETWALPDTPAGLRELDLLKVRSRDVLEHIERVVHHVRRLEQSTETAVQMHFSVQSNRTNDIMRTLTALTAVFLPLNLIAGIFGMNFEFLPLIHKADGFWWALGSMVFIALSLVMLFWRKRYLARTR